MSTEPTTQKRTFAKLFTSEKYGDILVVADTNDEGDPCVRITVDTHPDALNPSSIVMSFGEDACQFEKLTNFTQEHAEALAKGVFQQAAQFVPSAE